MSMLQHIEDELYELDYSELTYIKNTCEQLQEKIMNKAKRYKNREEESHKRRYTEEAIA